MYILGIMTITELRTLVKTWSARLPIYVRVRVTPTQDALLRVSKSRINSELLKGQPGPCEGRADIAEVNGVRTLIIG